MAEQRGTPPRGDALAEIGVLALVGVVLALVGPFGTDTLGLGLRLVYWIGGMVAGWLVLQAILLVMRPVAMRFGLPFPLEYLLAVPMLAALGVVLIAVFGGNEGGAVSQLLFAQVAALGLGIFLLFGLLYTLGARRNTTQPAAKEPPAKASPPLTDTRLHQRLPPAFGPILALAVEDHYVTVIGPDAREMVLMNLVDAIAEAGETEGLRTHRSWWVAHGALTALKRDNRNMRAVLSNGSQAPVSRTRVAAVKAALER